MALHPAGSHGINDLELWDEKHVADPTFPSFLVVLLEHVVYDIFWCNTMKHTTIMQHITANCIIIIEILIISIFKLTERFLYTWQNIFFITPHCVVDVVVVVVVVIVSCCHCRCVMSSLCVVVVVVVVVHLCFLLLSPSS